MSKRTIFTWILLIGDLLVIGLFAFFRISYYSSPPRPMLDLLITTAPHLFAWLLVSPRWGALRLSQPKGAFLRHSLLAWLIAGLVAEGSRAAILWFVLRVIQMPLASLFNIVEGAIWVLAWRAVFKVAYDLVSDAAHPLRRRLAWGLILALSGVGVLLTLPFIFTTLRYSSAILQISTLPESPTALVFGAGVYPDGTPSRVLVERMNTAGELFRSAKVSRLILSGDSREAEAMRRLALAGGLPEEALSVDSAGVDTYASCARLAAQYSGSQVVLISQRYHLPRAIFTCEGLGVHAVGLAAENPPGPLQTLAAWYLREIPATALAWQRTLLVKSPIQE